MSSHLVDGVPLPDHVAGHVALEFCNTRAGWGTPTPREYLTSPNALVLWATEHELLLPRPGAPRRSPDDDLAVLPQRVVDLREALYACLLGHGDGDAWDRVAAAARRAREAAVLRPGTDGAPARWTLPAPRFDDTLDLTTTAVHRVALAAEDLLTSPLVAGVAACPGEGCGWLFLDPRGRRRWCSMAVCGNRAKARRHAHRTGTATPR